MITKYEIKARPGGNRLNIKNKVFIKGLDITVGFFIVDELQ
jgi:hypothetical protein